MSDNYYIVRGAKMRCDKGTHARKINLPESHGAYATEKPMMNKSDNVVNKNISYFGICRECKEGEDIYLIGEDGVQLPPGKKCLVKISGDWMKVKEDTLVDGKPALTAESVLICSLHQGKIKFVTTGQEQE
ncbi:DUF4280 domain-containing protein [Clostridium estertheticum]|uniref:DUF4280 domain-containing protein n=1 Tax=Clostridium estertheticum TaxID=238834 RepID=UPI001C6EE99B|nr:DUF4280 domain-containing protein [Clostridium estertheticum]MBW9154817.1 DUF4280 domain-containing protein [Clostridium estertheticum]MCB2343383.1 DUF4280 domain-containing protein [Clostridium estertheticum]WAG43343.1 DUF4280 domain-containing protein [Clostridium estertheticum]WLC82517.1 DUF4280 domain-containing protein [Clostridium estertheticum]WLC82524.1 DUF4280 domain-containing protein [Clostridium estertheticum]